MLPFIQKQTLRFFLLLLLIVEVKEGIGQGETNNWFFHDKNGMTFNAGSPQNIPCPNHLTGIGTTVASDSVGNLLFYSDGTKVFTKTHLLMENGDGLLGWGKQACITFPQPGSKRYYYIFTVDLGAFGFRYSMIDMEANTGEGRVTVKNQSIIGGADATIALTATLHRNNRDVWVITRKQDLLKYTYAAYLITPSGISDPVNSDLIKSIGGGIQSEQGQVRVSPDGRKLMDPQSESGNFFHFDNQTGAITWICKIQNSNWQIGFQVEGIEFSPSSKYVYLSGPGNTNQTHGQFYVSQFDASANDSISFMSSQKIVGKTHAVGTGMGIFWMMQIGPDGKIYGSREFIPKLFTINRPDEYDTACHFQLDGFDLQGDCKYNLPQFLTSYGQRFYYVGSCAGTPYHFTSNFYPAPDSIHWDFGDGSTSTQLNPTHIYSAGGIYLVAATVRYPDGRTGVAEREITVSAMPYPNLGTDTLVCAGTDVTLTPGSGFTGYYWNGSIMPGNPTYLASDSGTYIVRVKNDLGCYNADTIQVLQRPTPALDETNLNIAPTTCGKTNGAITGLQLNGQPPYALQWTASGTPVSDSLDIYHLGTGLYELHVTDGFGCNNLVASYAISDAGNLWIDTATVTPAYCGNTDGTLTITAISGLGSMLQYFIKTGSDTLSKWGDGNFAGLAGGIYYVWVSDSGGCSKPYAYVLQIDALTAPEILTATSTPETGSAADGTITVNALGIGLTYSLNGATPAITGLFTGLSAGDYSITVTNPAGCDTTLTITVAHETGIVLSAIAGNGFACLGKEAKAPIVVRNFKDVQSFETILNYDPLFVTCLGYNNRNPLLVGSLEVTLPASGKILTRWSGTVPLTLPDSAEMLNLIFNSKLPGNALLLWDENPEESNFLGPGGDTLNVDYTLGTILVSNPPQILPDPKQTVCEGEFLWVSETVVNGTGTLSYQWQTPTGPSSQEIIIKTATLADNGLYQLIVTDTLQCADTSTKIVTVVPTPVSGFPTDTDTLYFDERRWLEAAQGYDTYSWNTGDTTNSILVTAEGWYKVTIATPEGCTTTDSVMMLYAFVPLTMPNAFTPDGDGLNDVFRPVTLPEKISSFSMYIYDRWGKQVFFTNDVTHGWDGTINGSPAQIGGYVYVVKYGNPSGAEREKRGMVMVVR